MTEAAPLHQTLEAARALMLAHGESHWADKIGRAASLLADDEAAGVAAVLGLFGGMGSLTDRLPIDAGPDAAPFKALIDQAYDLAYRRSKALRR